jgi:MFS family permease
VVGHYGDKVGRRPALILTAVLMGGSTVLMGLLPAYSTLGIWAPILLVLARLGQGFGAGAELAGAICFIAGIHTDARWPRRRHVPVLGLAGPVLASVVILGVAI